MTRNLFGEAQPNRSVTREQVRELNATPVQLGAKVLILPSCTCSEKPYPHNGHPWGDDEWMGRKR